MLLVDGAVLNPIPSDVVKGMGADIVIGVDLVPTETVGNITNIFDVIIQSIDIMERELSKNRLQCCDLCVKPDVAHISPSNFSAVEECVSLGQAAMEKALPELKELMDGWFHK